MEKELPKFLRDAGLAEYIEIFELLPEQELIESQKWLQNFSQPWPEVLKLWQKTAPNRISQLTEINDLSIAAILKDWPLLKHPLGYTLVCSDFKISHPTEDLGLLTNWALNRDKILKVMSNRARKDKLGAYQIVKNFSKEISEGAAVSIGALLIVIAAVLAVVFPQLIVLVVNSEVALRDGGRTFGWWRAPPVTPRIGVYIYNVTNADEFLNNGEKPILQELGPYVYLQRWEKVEVKFNGNDTVSYRQHKEFFFSPELSAGSEDDLVVVPNVPMLSATSQTRHAARFLRLAMASIMDILKIKPFVEVSVGQLLWGYDDPLLKLAKDVMPKEQMLPYDQFGLLYGKNGTTNDAYTIYTGQSDITKYGMLDMFNGKNGLGHWTTPSCDTVFGGDGSIFPPHITKDTILRVFDKDLCRAMPLVFKEEVSTAGDVPGYRFSPPKDVFATTDQVAAQMCFCPEGPPCAPQGTFNASKCQYDSPILISFPHFLHGDPALREAVVGISPPDEEKHQLFVDVQPTMGTALRGRARVQINLAVSQVRDIKQVESFPDIVFPIMWFEDGIDELPIEVTSLLKMAVDLPPIARVAVSAALGVIGIIVLIGSLMCLARAAKRQEKLHLSNPLPSNATKKADHNLGVRSVSGIQQGFAVPPLSAQKSQ